MRFSDYAAPLALLGSTTVSAFGRHSSHQGLLQMSPSFAKEGVNLYPALHPDHDATDLNHLIPEVSKRLHFSQEGHRPALHGAKHAHLEGTFSHPTVVLEHSSHIDDVVCTERQIQVFFKTKEALNTVEQHWQEVTTAQGFNLITYHIDCGHLTGEQRSFFRASQPRVEGNSITVTTHLIDENDAIHGGNLEWGTYQKPNLAKRQLVKGHVRASRAQEVIVDGEGGNATVDITKDQGAFKEFFPGLNSYGFTDIPDEGTYGGGFLDYDGFEQDDLARRGLFSWIINGIKALIDLVAFQVEAQIRLIITIAKVMITIAATTVKLFLVPFGFPFDQEYHADIKFNHYVPKWIGIGSDPATTIAGAVANSNIPGTVAGVEDAIKKGLITEDQAISSGLKGKDLKDSLEAVYSKSGGSLYLNCDACGTKGSFTFDGKLAFSIADGLTKAQVSLINNEEFVLEAIFGLKLQGRAIRNGGTGANGKQGLKSTVSRQIASIPLSPLYIPGLLTIGPQVVVEPQASLYADGSIEIKAGPRFTISPGNVTLDAKSPDQNVAQGWEPHFEFVFDPSASIVVTADLALQVGIEVALDVLTGTYKTSAGIYTAPSVYLNAEYSKNKKSDDTGELKACDSGIELRAGAKNRVYSSIFGLREWEFKELGTTFADVGLGCIHPDRKQVWSSKDVEKTKVLDGHGFETGVGKEVSKQLNGMIASKKSINVTSPDKIELGDQHATALKHKGKQGSTEKMPQTHGFRVVQDAEMTATLVSGTDGRVYMSDNSADHDLSAPWGALDVKKEQFSYDVFGRLMWFNSTRLKNLDFGMVEIGVASAEKMPMGVSTASFKVIRDEGGKANDGKESFAMALNASMLEDVKDGRPEWLWYPTVCRIPNRGLQLFASKYIINENGGVGSDEEGNVSRLVYAYAYRRSFWELGLPKLTKEKKKHGSGKKKHKSPKKFESWLYDHHLEKQLSACRTVRLISGLKKKG